MPCCFVYVAPLVTPYNIIVCTMHYIRIRTPCTYIFISINTTRFFVSFVQTIYVMFLVYFFFHFTLVSIYVPYRTHKCSQLGSRRFSIFIYGWVLLCVVWRVIGCTFCVLNTHRLYMYRKISIYVTHIGFMEYGTKTVCIWFRFLESDGMGAHSSVYTSMHIRINNINNGHDGVERLRPYACIKCTCLLSINAKN